MIAGTSRYIFDRPGQSVTNSKRRGRTCFSAIEHDGAALNVTLSYKRLDCATTTGSIPAAETGFESSKPTSGQLSDAVCGSRRRH